MRLESNFVQVENNPVVINKVNGIAAAFGWTVQSIQVTDSAVAYESGAVGWTTEFGTLVNKTVSVKRTTYASITYQRDIEDPKYWKWVRLENAYNDVLIRSFLNEDEQRRYEEIREETDKENEKNYRSVMKTGQCVFYALALFSFVVILGEPDTILIMGILALIFICLGYIIYNLGMKTTRKAAIDRLNERTLSKNREYVQLMQVNTMRREQARMQILNRARAL